MGSMQDSEGEILKKKILDTAQSRLITSAYDLYHDLAHHQAVFALCKKIIQDEGLVIDLETLEIACYWHDVFKGKGDQEEKLLRQELEKLGLNQEKINKVVKIIAEHSFGNNQTLEESKILYDADKIELVSIPRWKAAFDAYDKGEVDIATRDKYVKEWNRRMPLLENHLHYSSTNLLFTKRLKEFKDWLRSINRMDKEGNFISEI